MLQQSFWDLHQQLGECYNQDLRMMQEEVERLSNLLPAPTASASLPGTGKTARRSDPSGLPPSPSLGPVQPRARTDPVPAPKEDMEVLELSQGLSGLWQSAAFQEDLQACVLQKRDMELLLSDGDRCEKDRMRHEATKNSSGEVEGFGAEAASEVTFHVRAFWAERQEGLEELKQLQRVSVRARRPSVQSMKMPLQNQQTWSDSATCVRSLQHPSSPFRAWWETMGMMLLCYDLIVIPLKAFDVGESFFLSFMFWTAHIYWNLAIPMSFIRGYDDSGVLVMDLWKTIPNYARSWFLFDLALVAFDWIIITSEAAEAASGVARLSRTLRALRFLRLLRLGRVVRVGSVIQSLQEQLSSRMANIQYSIVKIMVQSLISNHIIACVWFLIGSGEGDSTWLQAYEIKNQPPSVQYATSLHWSFVQLGVGQSEIEAQNLSERIFSVVISFLALINFSTMVSSMTSLMASLQKMKDEEIEQFTLLRKYLGNNQIDPDLSHRITRFLQHTFDLKKKAMSKDGQIPILDMLSKPLHEELQLQKHSECLSDSAFFKMLLEDADLHVHRVVCEIVTGCMQASVLALEDVIFSAGSIATMCYYVAEGACRYERESLAPTKALSHVWVADACLWTPWLHLGDLVSKDISRLITIEVASFCECIGKDQEVRLKVSAYAADFVSHLNEKKRWSDLLPETSDVIPTKEVRSAGCCTGWFRGGRVFNQVLPG